MIEVSRWLLFDNIKLLSQFQTSTQFYIRSSGAIVMKFLSYFGYFGDNNNGESGKTLSQKIQETNDTTLINFALEKYFAAQEKIREMIMNHSRYIDGSFSKADEGLSSLENGDETAFENYYDTGRFGDKCTKDTFVSRMGTFVEDGRQKIPPLPPQDLKEKESKKKKKKEKGKGKGKGKDDKTEPTDDKQENKDQRARIKNERKENENKEDSFRARFC